jgi:hypothetical protein
MCRQLWLLLFLSLVTAQATPTFVPVVTNTPLARVVIVENQKATRYFAPNTSILPQMVDHAIARFAQKPNSKEAWKTLLTSNDVVGIKVYSAPGRTVGTRPELVDALVANMIESGINPLRIVIWDKRQADLLVAGFDTIAKRRGVRLAAAGSYGWDEKVFYENSILGVPVWGDLEFEKKGEQVGRKSHTARMLTQEVTKIITVTPLLNHNIAGVSGHLYNLALGSVDNAVRFESSPERLATAVPEICSSTYLIDHLLFCLTDALVCQYQGQNDTLLHYATPLNQLWISKDPVASDVLGIEELDRQRRLFHAPEQKLPQDLYHNANLMELGIADPRKITVERIR